MDPAVQIPLREPPLPRPSQDFDSFLDSLSKAETKSPVWIEPDEPGRQSLPLNDAELEKDILRGTLLTSNLRFLRGRLAALLLSKKGWFVLGYSRIGDYSRERLGIAGRTLEDDARVARALERLPRLRSAFLESSLSWTQVRLVSAVADPASELEWIAIAGSCCTTCLAARIKNHECAARDPATAAESVAENPPGHSCSSEREDHADHPNRAVRFSVQISCHGRRLWRAACEMAERRAGSVLTQAQVLELVIAEAASGEWMSAPRHRDPVFERDGWRCTVPGCRSRRNLHDHHVRFRSHGGGNTRDNRITVCASHHLHGLHAGRICAHGHAPHEIIWEMPLGRLFGDRYL
jgi:hypothetical protein